MIYRSLPGRNLPVICLLFVVIVILNFSGCFYSFTGASVPSHLQTVAIPVIEDRSGRAEAGLSESLTSTLIQKFVDDNTLQISERVNADALVENTIVSFDDNPSVISSGPQQGTQTSGEQISTKRITITVRTVFRDLIQKRIIFDRRFSNFSDYSTVGDVFNNRREAIQKAVDLVTEDILIGTVSNW